MKLFRRGPRVIVLGTRAFGGGGHVAAVVLSDGARFARVFQPGERCPRAAELHKRFKAPAERARWVALPSTAPATT